MKYIFTMIFNLLCLSLFSNEIVLSSEISFASFNDNKVRKMNYRIIKDSEGYFIDIDMKYYNTKFKLAFNLDYGSNYLPINDFKKFLKNREIANENLISFDHDYYFTNDVEFPVYIKYPDNQLEIISNAKTSFAISSNKGMYYFILYIDGITNVIDDNYFEGVFYFYDFEIIQLLDIMNGINNPIDYYIDLVSMDAENFTNRRKDYYNKLFK